MVIVPTEKRFDWNQAPIALFIIVILNTIVYFGYQHQDQEKTIRALSKYEEQGFLQYEWPAYKKYLTAQGDAEKLKNMESLYSASEIYADAYLNLLAEIVQDDEFFKYLQKNAYDIFEISYVEYWNESRVEINRLMSLVSYKQYGLIPKNMDFFTFISSQFLHGSTMHLLGNMFFLIVCGFAIEAAIGHLRFVVFYLISGIAGGLLFCLVDTESSMPLVGASGAISGVMAMYLALFRFKKIEFFYWFFIFVGYFRAPALLILPLYIGKELYNYYYETGSNVAFMAHAGGFIAGAISIALSWIINPRILNQEYIEEDQAIPKRQKDLAIVNKYISQFKFRTALAALDKFVNIYGESFQTLAIRYNILKILSDKSRQQLLVAMSQLSGLLPNQLDIMHNIWDFHKNAPQEFDDDDLFKIGLVLANEGNYQAAEEIFTILNGKQIKHPLLVNLARKLSKLFKEKGNNDKGNQYEHFILDSGGR